MPTAVFRLPDTIASLPSATFEFTPAAADESATVLSGPASTLFQRLLRDQETDTALLVALRVVSGFLRRAEALTPDSEMDADAIGALVRGQRDELAGTIAALDKADPQAREAVLRQRAPLSLLTGCWLDTLSQPATQPAVIVNRLFAHHFRCQGEGNPQRSIHHLRRRALEGGGVFLPDIDAEDFPAKTEARPLTMLHAAFYLALSRLPANHLPEVVGVHYVVNALGVDDLLIGTEPVLCESELRAVLAEYLTVAGPVERRRLRTAVTLALALEREHVAALAALAEWHRGLSLDAKVAAIIERHAPYAGRQHRNVRVAGRPLTETFDDPAFDVAAFVRELRTSRQFKPMRDGTPRFLRAIKFGGPMFGIFDEREASLFTAWAAAIQAGDLPEVEITPNRVGDGPAAEWSAAVAHGASSDVRYADAHPRDDREMFHRLVNIENHPNTLPLARRRAMEHLAAAEMLFAHGAAGRYTDATWFEYTPQALIDRVHQIYWDKLVKPYQPLAKIPDRDAVVFGQKTFALGSMIDGTWAYRIGNLGRFRRPSDGMLFSIYADEMGRGDLRKNHITLIHQVLGSMSIELPHIRDVAFLDQEELPDDLYGFSIHQICLALFPDSFYNEILGYNLGIEMFGLGEMRLHEMQKLRHHGFDVAYEEAHLSIDNMSAGHARQSADIIVSYLDDVARTVGPAVVREEWRRVWRGYASFAYFVEHELVRDLPDSHSDSDSAGTDADLTI